MFLSPSLDLSDNLKKMRDLARALRCHHLAGCGGGAVGLRMRPISNAVVPLCHARVPARLQAAGEMILLHPPRQLLRAGEFLGRSVMVEEEDATPRLPRHPLCRRQHPSRRPQRPQTMLQPSDLRTRGGM